jgi:hypothetical protein
MSLPSVVEICLPTLFTLVSCVTYSSTLKAEAICSSETSINFQRSTRLYIPEDRTLQRSSFKKYFSSKTSLMKASYIIAFRIIYIYIYIYIVAYRPVFSGDSVNNSRCYAIKKCSFYATVEVLLDYNSGNGVFSVVRAEML